MLDIRVNSLGNIADELLEQEEQLEELLEKIEDDKAPEEDDNALWVQLRYAMGSLTLARMTLMTLAGRD